MGIRYEIDPYNRLVLKKSAGEGGLSKFRQVLEGRFRLDADNELSYHVKAPLSNAENAPNQLRLKGEWSLTDHHELCLIVDKDYRDTFGDRLTLRGEMLDADESSLAFAVTTKKGQGESTYVLSLSGSWKADGHNRLSFHVRKEGGKYDVLTFNGVWDLDDNHQIIYEYEKASLIRKKKRSHTLTFRGHWDIRNKYRISYVLSGSRDSVFDFQANAGVFKENYIEYELGIRLNGRIRPVKQVVTISGRWLLKKGSGLSFEISYADGRISAVTFGAEARLAGKDTICFELKDDAAGRDLGISLELSRRLLKGNGEAFLRLLRSKKESAAYVGSAWRW